MIRIYETQFGPLWIAISGPFLLACDWMSSARFERHRDLVTHTCGISLNNSSEQEIKTMKSLIHQLDRCFAGHYFQPAAAHKPIGSPFRHMVWNELMHVGYGERITYGELAARCGTPRAVRAVASAVADNPVSIFIPCHRIVPASGATGNYAGGSAAKKFLLDREATTFCSLTSDNSF